MVDVPLKKISQEEAYQRLLQQKYPSRVVLLRNLQAEGYEIDKEVLDSWAREFDWSTEVRNIRLVGRGTAALIRAAKAVTPEMMKGLHATALFSLAARIPTIKVETAQDAKVMLSLLNEIRNLEHSMLGDAITSKASQAPAAPPEKSDGPTFAPFMQRAN